MRFLPTSLLVAVLLAFAACGDGTSGDATDDDTLAIEGQPPPVADTSDIRNEPLTPATLSDPRIEALGEDERRILQDYVRRGVRRDSLESPRSQRDLGGWLDSNLTVGQVIALYRNVEAVEPMPE